MRNEFLKSYRREILRCTGKRPRNWRKAGAARAGDARQWAANYEDDQHRPAIERLENRELLSAAYSAGILGVAGYIQPTLVAPASVSGTAFNDLNANGLQNSGEKGLAGWKVYDDVANNGIFVPGDPSTTTDASGHYKLANLSPGPHTIRIVTPNTTWRQLPQTVTLAAGQNVAGRNYATLPLYRYAITDLGTLGGAQSYPTSINDTGQIVGQADTATAGDAHAFLYNPITRKMTDLGTFGGATSIAKDINNSGQIVGSADLRGKDPAAGNPITAAFLYSNGKLTNLGNLPGTNNNVANSINDAGQIVGTGQTPPDPTDPYQQSGGVMFLYSGGKIALEVFGSGSYDVPTSINNGGQIAGYFYSPPFKGPGHDEAFLYTGGKFKDLGTLAEQQGATDSYPPFNSDAYSITSSGQIVGRADTATGGSHAILYTGGKFVDLGTLTGNAANSSASGINNGGWIVGRSYLTGTSSRAFLYAADQMVNLNDTLAADSHWTLSSATAINSSNQIVGQGINPQGQTHAFLLTPMLVSISGTVFKDLNGDGKKGVAEGGVKGWQVYADLKHTGVYATGDPSAITDGSGNYRISGLAAGGYTIRIVPKAGYRATVPTTFSETLVAAGQAVAGSSFGEVAVGPYFKTPASFGLIQAENFDLGGQGAGYFNAGNINRGGVYRPNEGVGIGAIPQAVGGGYFLGWTQPGEWVNYTVTAAATGTYTLKFRVASAVTGGTFHVNIDGVNVTGTLAVPNTGDWNSYTVLSKTGVHISAGTHVLQLVFDTKNPNGGTGNFDWIQAVKT